VRSDVAVIMSAGTPATELTNAATATIPIVTTAVGDPIGSGIVASPARPGGNVTGLSLLDTELDSERIELLKEAADLPVEQPAKFEFVINRRAARSLGLAIPSSLIARADQVIEGSPERSAFELPAPAGRGLAFARPSR
jgi:ABC-type uncharacterized transport system substrate-binding protein